MDSISLATITAILTRLGTECTEGRASEADTGVWVRIKGLFGWNKEPEPQELPKAIATTLNDDRKLLNRIVKLLWEARDTDAMKQMIGSQVECLTTERAIRAVKFERPRRDRVVLEPAVWVGEVLAFGSLILGVAWRVFYPSDDASWFANVGRYVAIALWALGPPIWFWFEWSFLTNNFDEKEIDNLKHSHALSATVWLAVGAVLAFLFKVPPFKT